MARTVYRESPDCPIAFVDIFGVWLIRIVLYQPPQLIQQALAGVGAMKGTDNICGVAYLYFSDMKRGGGFWLGWFRVCMVIVGHRGPPFGVLVVS